MGLNNLSHLTTSLRPAGSGVSAPRRQASFRVDRGKLPNLNNEELIRLVQHYMDEHELVRKENKELQDVTQELVRDQNIVCKENERLLKKLEEMTAAVEDGRVTPFVPSSHSFRTGEEILSQSRIGLIKPSTGDSQTSSDIWVNPEHKVNAKYTSDIN